jgi:hypothetical protein
MLHDILGVIRLEIAVARHMKVDDDGHDLASTQFGFRTRLVGTSQQPRFRPIGDHFAEIIDIAEQLY